jgi:nicotinamide phosphoribosyltransferase
MKLRPQDKSLKKETPYNPILDSDSYKISHHLQYPEGASAMFSYIESRGGEYDRTLWFGLQYINQKYLQTQITTAMIDEAEDYITKHGMGKSFNREGWEYIVSEYDGYIPLKIKSVKEGAVVPTKNILAYAVCKDPKAFWVVSYFETLLLRVWSPVTTATKSFVGKQIIIDAFRESSDEPVDNLFKLTAETGVPQALLFKLHDFGARGGSSYETVSIASAAHLVNFFGTDTLSALKLLREHYDCDCAGYSIDASEHSTMTALGPAGEFIQFERMIDKFGDRDMFACVSDGFDIFNAITNGWGGALIERVKAMNAILIVRPDSGDPIEIPIQCIKLLDEKFGHTINGKGYKVLNHVRVIQGDGIRIRDLQKMIDRLHEEGFSIDNLAFGMGGGLIQDQTRDTQKFAMKNSWMLVNGETVNVYKDPITDHGKKSKKGRMTLMWDGSKYLTYQELTDDQFENPEEHFNGEEALEWVFDTGSMVKVYRFDEIRQTAEMFLQ